MRNTTEQYEVSRQFAAEILNVSVRTLDRYTKKKQISSVRRGRQLFFSEDDLLNFKGQLLAKEMGKIKQVRQDDFQDVHRAQVMEQQDSGSTVGFENQPENMAKAEEKLEQKLYKELYQETEAVNRQLRKQVEGATYRIGQLEAQISSMIPVLEYNKQKDELLLLAEENQFKKEDIKNLELNLNIERFAKKIYAGVLWVVLIMIPLLLILRMLS